MMKKYGSIHGFILGVLCIFGAYFIEGGSLGTLFLIAPILIVFGGTFSATIIGFGYDQFRRIFQLTKLAYFPRKYNLENMINTFVDISIKARRQGLLTIEKDLSDLEYLFPRKLIRYAIDGTDVNDIENLALLEMKIMQDRHYSNIQIFSKMGGYAPTMGILGTVMALIMTLANAGTDPNILIRNIAAAFIATLWGVLSANLIWFPISDKLKKCHLEEKHMMQIALEGALALQSGEIPSILKARLISMLPQKDQIKMLNS
jgi:chemotaxis protein MotA